jgi:hypothetical protein
MDEDVKELKTSLIKKFTTWALNNGKVVGAAVIGFIIGYLLGVSP